jgi:hypothetical protein
MQRLLLFIFILIGFSCNNIINNNDEEVTKSARKYTEDFYFKNNVNVEFLEFNLIKLDNLNSSEMDSIIFRMIKNELLKTALKIGGYNNQEISSAFSDPDFSKYRDAASKSFEYQSYRDSLKIYMYKPGYIAHFYSKFKLSDQENNFLNNRLYEDRTYLISENYKVIKIIN